MRIFLAGASGVLGVRMVPLLVNAGHTVAGMTRTPAKTDRLRALGAEPIVCDALEQAAVREAVVSFAPEMIIDQLTDLPDDASRIDEHRAAQNRIRRDGIRNLIAAADGMHARLLSQSIAWTLGGDAQAAVEDHERQAHDARGVVLRYGQLYGPGTFYERDLPPPPRVHVDRAVMRSLAAFDEPAGAIITILD